MKLFAAIAVLICATLAQGQVTKNIVTDFGCTCNGTADDSAAADAYTAWAIGFQVSNPGELITLLIPSGKTFRPNRNFNFGIGPPGVVVSMYGGGIHTGVAGNHLGTSFGVYFDNLHSSRVSTVASGATSVTLLTTAESSRFTVGQWALVTGLDMQGYGFPANPAFWNYVLVSAVDSMTGVVSFSTTPLTHQYKSTWPLYDPGSSMTPDQGGPATIYALYPEWAASVTYEGGTITTPSAASSVKGIAKTFTYRDVTVAGTGEICPNPSVTVSWTLDNVTCPGIEVDKIVDSVTITDSTIDALIFQSASVKSFTVSDSAIATGINGLPVDFTATNTTFGHVWMGASAYGASNSFLCSTCTITSFATAALYDNGGGMGVDTKYSMSGGVITSPNSNGALGWAVPGTHLFLSGTYTSEGFPFTITDVTQDVTNTYIHTSLLRGWPSVPTSGGGGELRINVHPAPHFTCTNCTGSADAVDLSQAPAGAPVYSYTQRTYAGNIGQAATINIWGNVQQVNINVVTPYTGVESTLPFNAIFAFGRALVNQATGAEANYNLIINLKTAGLRHITPAGVTGTQTGDSALTLPGSGVPQWIANTLPTLGTDIGAECIATPAVCPIVTIEIQTDQNGIVGSSFSGTVSGMTIK